MSLLNFHMLKFSLCNKTKNYTMCEHLMHSTLLNETCRQHFRQAVELKIEGEWEDFLSCLACIFCKSSGYVPAPVTHQHQGLCYLYSVQ